MLKNPLLSGWFRKRPFLNSFVVTTLISPMVLIFVQSTLAEQSKLAKTASGMEKTDLVAHNSALQANNSQAKLAEKKSQSQKFTLQYRLKPKRHPHHQW